MWVTELETKYGWNGLLVEATPVYYHQLLQKHRKAFSVRYHPFFQLETLKLTASD